MAFMVRSKNVGRRVALLVVLLVAATLFVVVFVLNVTYWYVNTTAINITRFHVTGIVGDVVNITNALKVCNRYDVPVKIRISDVSLLQDHYPGNTYIRYMAVKIVDPPGAADNKVVIKDEAAVDTTTDYVTLRPGQCAILGVDLMVDANAPRYKTLAAYQINIEKVPPDNVMSFRAVNVIDLAVSAVGVDCSFVSSSGKRFGSPDGTPATGFNELNGWVAAWGPSGGGVRIALMPGITPPDSTGTGARYTVQLNNVQIGTLTVSGGTASVTIAEPMPGFMQVVRIWLEPGGYILYDNGPRQAVVPPGAYQVYATLRVAPRSDVYGSTADLTLTCGGTPTATITLRVPNPNEWGLRADIYTFTTVPPPWPPFGSGYTYKGTWSVGAMYFWSSGYRHEYDRIGLTSPYSTRDERWDIAPKWVAYWVDPAATSWRNWAVKFTGRLYVPWSSIRVGVWHDNGVYVKLCSIDTGDSWWTAYAYKPPTFDRASGTCSGAPGEYSIEARYYEDYGAIVLVFIIGPEGGNEAYVPTIDGAWRCPNFDWSRGTCRASWSFVPASPAVPHFVGTNYTPSSTNDGGGTPRP